MTNILNDLKLLEYADFKKLDLHSKLEYIANMSGYERLLSIVEQDIGNNKQIKIPITIYYYIYVDGELYSIDFENYKSKISDIQNIKNTTSFIRAIIYYRENTECKLKILFDNLHNKNDKQHISSIITNDIIQKL